MHCSKSLSGGNRSTIRNTFQCRPYLISFGSTVIQKIIPCINDFSFFATLPSTSVGTPCSQEGQVMIISQSSPQCTKKVYHHTKYWRYDPPAYLWDAISNYATWNRVQWSYNGGIMERYPLYHLWPLFLWWRWRFTEEHWLFLHEFAHQQPRKLSCTCSTFWSHLLGLRCTCLGVPTGIWTLQWKLIQYFGVLEWLRS